MLVRLAAPTLPPQAPPEAPAPLPPAVQMPFDGAQTIDPSMHPALAQALANAPAIFEQARRAEAVKKQWAATRCGLCSEDDRGPCLLDRGHRDNGSECMDQKGPFGHHV